MTERARRRFLAVPAGTYPPPVPPGSVARTSSRVTVQVAGAAVQDMIREPEPTLVEGMQFDDFGPGSAVAAAATPPSQAAVSEPVPAVAAPEPARFPPREEPDLDALLSGPVSPTFASLGPDYTNSIEAHDPALTVSRRPLAATNRRSGRWDGFLPGRMLLFAALGAVIGALAGFGLLTLRPDSAGDLNPVTLWQSADPNMQLMTVLVIVGFALLGSALGARGSGGRSSS